MHLLGFVCLALFLAMAGWRWRAVRVATWIALATLAACLLAGSLAAPSICNFPDLVAPSHWPSACGPYPGGR